MEQLELIKEERMALNLNSGAIHIEHKMSLKERQVWMYLAWKAIPIFKQIPATELEEKVFKLRVNLSEIKKAIGYKGNNNDRMKVIFDNLLHTIVKWNIFGKEVHRWGGCSLLSYYEVESTPNKAICTFAFNPIIQVRLAYPEMYAKINLLISREFKSKNALAIYCLALDYLNVRNNYGEKVLSLEEIRLYLGLTDEDYKNAGDLYRWVIKPAEKEINKKSDMKLEIEVRKENPRKKNSKIEAFKLKMSIKEETLEYYKVKATKDIDSRQTRLFENLEQPNKSINLISISNKDLQSFLEKYDIVFNNQTIIDKYRAVEKDLQENTESYLLWLGKRVEATVKKSDGKITKPSGLFVKNIDAPENITAYKNQVEKQKEANKRKEDELEKEYNALLQQNFSQYVGKQCITFLTQKEENQSRFYEFIKKEQESWNKGQEIMFQGCIKNNNNQIDFNLLKFSSFRALYLGKISEQFGFIEPDFQSWKTAFEKNPENKEYISELKRKAQSQTK